MPNFVSTKVAIILALLAREDYPSAWAYPFRDVSNALSVQNGSSSSSSEAAMSHDNSGISMNLRFLHAISDEIVYPAVDEESDAASSAVLKHISTRREKVKDMLRGFTINPNNQTQTIERCIPFEQTDAAQIIGSLLDTITTYAITINATNLNIQEERQEVAARAAMTLKRYLSWVDLQLATYPSLVFRSGCPGISNK
jgi:hypothetical protein